MSRGRRVAKASVRAQRGGGTETPLSGPQTSQAVTGPDGEWFGPGRALAPVAPRSVAGRRFDFMFGQNMQIHPRGQGGEVPFALLRQFADAHDLTRLAIETCKDRLSRLEWTFGLVDSDDDLNSEQQVRAARYRAMLRRPDGENFWIDWLRSLLEDLLVIDAPSIFVRRTRDLSEVVGLYQVDGATIKPEIDNLGRVPEYPAVAYQQVLHGMPAVSYTRREMVYRPRNRRVHRIYGYSPVEQILATISIALRRQLWQHSYFTHGNIPDSLIGVPSTWTPDQIRDFQDWFDDLLTGSTQRRRSGIFVPGEVAKSYVPTKEAEIFGAAEEWLARVVCFAFGISHQALVKEVNRATASTAKEQAEEDGMAPVMGWVKSVMDGILIDHLGETEIEFRWADDREMDPQVKDQIWKGRVDSGMADRNEWRADVGMDARTEPEASMLTTSTAENATPLSLDDQISQQQRRTASGAFPTTPTPGDPSSASGGAEGKDGGEGDQSASSSTQQQEEGASKAAVPFGQAGAGKSAEGDGPLGEPHDPSSLTEEQLTAFRALSPERPVAEEARQRLETTLQGALRRVRGRVVRAVRAELQRLGAAVEKATPPITPTSATGALVLSDYADGIIHVAVEGIGSWDFMIDATAEDLAEVAADTTRQVIATLGPAAPEGLVDQVSEAAVSAARDRAAELVGRRVLADGSIIDNPSPRWAISDSTRTMIHDTIVRVLDQNEGSDALIQALESDHAFSPARAEMVSRTEIAGANSEAAMMSYRAARDAGVELRKEWLLGPNPCPICVANAEQGPIDIDEAFESGDDSTPAHPNCVCAVTPVL